MLTCTILVTSSHSSGFKRFGSNEALASGDAIRHLFKVYVEANAASFDPAFDAEARKTTELLEAGDEETIALWQKFRSLSAASYDKVYARLGIEFDVLYSESMYAKKAHEVAAALRKHGALTTESNGAEIVDFTAKKMGHAVIVKEDGGSVYLTRDIAAAADRKQTLDFDSMLYVAGATQDLHFKQLFHLLDDTLGYEWASSCSHVNFGNVQGMSTRQGSVVFLEDILDEARERMLEIIVRDPEKYGVSLPPFSQSFSNLSLSRTRARALSLSFAFSPALFLRGCALLGRSGSYS